MSLSPLEKYFKWSPVGSHQFRQTYTSGHFLLRKWISPGAQTVLDGSRRGSLQPDQLLRNSAGLWSSEVLRLAAMHVDVGNLGSFASVGRWGEVLVGWIHSTIVQLYLSCLESTAHMPGTREAVMGPSRSPGSGGRHSEVNRQVTVRFPGKGPCRGRWGSPGAGWGAHPALGE